MKSTRLLSLLMMSIVLFAASCSSNDGGAKQAPPTSETASEGDYELTPYGNGWNKAIKKQNDKVLEEGDMLDGKKVGTWITYHKRNGLTESITSYKDGVRHGLAITADDRGNITEKMFYVNGELEGKKISYNRTRIKKEEEYKNGQLDGTRKMYYDNGKLQEEGTFKNGKRDGYAKWFDEEGNMKFGYEYSKGEKGKDLPVEVKTEGEVK